MAFWRWVPIAQPGLTIEVHFRKIVTQQAAISLED